MSIYFLDTRLAVKRLLTDANLASPIFVCADKGLLAAAEAVGMSVDNPDLHP